MKRFSKLLSLSLILFVTLLFSCKKDSNDSPGTTGKNVKFTITVNGVSGADDYASFVIVGADLKNTKTLWKVNGVTKNNETSVSLGEDDFTGSTKTYVVESVTPLDVVGTSIQCLNFNGPYTISYKAEVNGKVITNDQNVTVDVNKDYTHRYDY
ncbi:hypothetical protein [Pedobacter punctiformis]|uniref:Lipoprotein n=1 Tax=Pedobacter punctiformis TaxID=3004097 RepID=A0ABT4L6G6_9SPHI|nr:hypothetical protein [Pedobacter sp. HCMS5-2]MCZ4243514.1 hypothetical protein [Pedobacter sp. HCMS5-2]